MSRMRGEAEKENIVIDCILNKVVGAVRTVTVKDEEAGAVAVGVTVKVT